ncbi:kinesin-like protein KIN-UC isoform X8 [Ziziphus jujuba]|uniref:Kinesin-like protein n=1 Tax=Ziziphus jujuba TaxID=326968 RepID=A0ABM3IDJ7_ZIZJJ|nr:kinesin-like protein KIN-UC isoform X8 [Ziziphus jujuba]
MASGLRSSSSSSSFTTAAGGGALSSSGRFERQLHGNGSSSSSSSSSSSAVSTQGGVSFGQTHLPGRSKAPSSRRSVTPNSRTNSGSDYEEDRGRVRVAVRLRPKNAEDIILDSDFADCVELQPELKRLKLRKNNWTSESYRFDEVFTETASQKRVYEVVAKPVVESVLNGYSGTVMAYGQTGTGKTYTLGKLGKDDASERGIMARALEDILASVSASDCVEVSYFQLYMECIQDLLAPEKINIPINEDPKTGEISLPGASVVKVQNLDQFSQLLQIGEANRHAANTKLNTESSRSHAILMVYIRRSVHEKVEDGITSWEKVPRTTLSGSNAIPLIRKSKLLIVDLAGSERIDKSGSEGHLLEEAKFINLSLTSLGKCINALAENSPHIPLRDSKLTRLLRDSFGGHCSARTSLIITIGPSARHYAETTSSVMFGQRAIKIVNMVKLKEEFDYEGLCRKLEHQVDHLTAEVERKQKLREDDKYKLEKELKECQDSFAEAKRNLITRSEFLEKENTRLEVEMKDLLNELKCQKDHNDLMSEKAARLEVNIKCSKQHQLESSTYQKVLADTTQMYEKKIAELIKQLKDEHAHAKSVEEQLNAMKKLLNDSQKTIQGQKEVDELTVKLQEMYQLHGQTLSELQSLKSEQEGLLGEKDKILYMNGNTKASSTFGTRIGSQKTNSLRETLSGQRATIAKICEEVGLQKILQLLTSEDSDVQIHAVKVVANLAAEDFNQEKIVEEGGLDALLMLLRSSQNTTILRVTSGAIANLAMNELNQGLIMSKGGAQLLAKIASKTTDLQTLRMVAGALANLCGNEKLHIMLKEDGGIKALLEMGRSGSNDVTAQIARGIANFAKCESRGINLGQRKGRSLLMDDGALGWLIANSNNSSTSAQRHVELALCHLAQNEDNVEDFISSGGVKELVRISVESSREDIRNLAKKMLRSSPTFRTIKAEKY